MENQELAKEGFRYFAFISYSHKDKKWAKWIQEAVEHYKLPAIIRKEAKSSLPQKLSPVFRDATHLGAGLLVKNLHSELEASKFLIVVCSPSAASSNAEGKCFVDTEVRHFCDLGRADRIIPVIVEGTPETSFCPKIKETEILALDATKFPKARILNDIVARMLGLRPDDLWKRERRQRIHRLIRNFAIAGLSCAMLSVLGLFIYDNYGEHKEYYADYVNEWEIPKGISPLSENEALSRNKHYEFTYRGYVHDKEGRHRKLRSVKHCNAIGLVVRNDFDYWYSRPVWQEFIYDNEDRLLKKVCRDRIGCLTSSYVFTYGQDTMMTKENGLPFSENADTSANQQPLYIKLISGMLNGIADAGWSSMFPELCFKTSPECFSIQERDDSGLPLCIIYGASNRQHSPRTDKYEAYGARHCYDAQGRMISVRLLDENYQVFQGLGDFAGVNITYSTLTNTVIAVDSQGNPTSSPLGWCIARYSFFENGNLKSISYYDTQDCLMSESSGAAIIEYEYDDSQRWMREEKRYSASKRLLHPEEGWAIREIRVKTDKDLSVDSRYFTDKGKDFVTNDGYSRVVTDFYPNGEREKYYRGENPIVDIRHSATEVERIFTSEDGVKGVFKRVASGAGRKSEKTIAVNGNFVDELEVVPAQNCFFKGLTANVSKAKATRKGIFGGAANSLLLEFFDEKGARITGEDTGADGLLFKFNDDGNVSLIANVKGGSLPHSDSKDVAPTCQIDYDSNGRIKTIRLLDEKGQPFTNKIGLSMVRFDIQRHNVVIECFGEDGKTRVTPVGLFSKAELECDRYDNAKWTRFYNSDDEPMEGPVTMGGCAVLHNEWTPDGRPLLIESYDANNQIMRDSRSGCYITKYEYDRDEEGRVVLSESFYDKDGVTPMRAKDGRHMTKTVVMGNVNFEQDIHSQMGNGSGVRVLSQSYWDVDKQSRIECDGIATTELQYDENGIPSGMKMFDKNNHMVVRLIDVKGESKVPVVCCFYHDDSTNMDFVGIIVAVDGEYCLCDTEKTEEKLTSAKLGVKIDIALYNTFLNEFLIVNVEFAPGEEVKRGLDAIPLETFSKIRSQYFPMKMHLPWQNEINKLLAK